ncbi:hypothetical protein [Herbaspirillum sp. alder98]|uniref:hypothetical protein n=1 Tax=Herbaspirillum sp. alder98 TaxID=2913096 RepID=UPI001CD84CA6|nr:hypothetical protein [Herbaspirillum sp. alder98]MCA1325554.1 hypothetical protein [Herbaspirillum sp. alder98]
MDVKELLNSSSISTDALIEVTGWLVDQTNGLFLLGEHYPEDFDFPIKVKISNSNVIYPILKVVPSLGGGKSALFYKAKILGRKNKSNELEIDRIYIQKDRATNELHEIDVNDALVIESVRKFGDYNFNHSRDPMGDWLDDFK